MIRILKRSEVDDSEVFARAVPQVNVAEVVAEVIRRVRTEGDKALLEYCEKWDGARLTSLRVTQEEIDEAVAAVDPAFLEILREAAANIRRFHEKQVRTSFLQNEQAGVVTGQKIIPLDRAGLYVPGGTAAYPSTVLMDAIPARIAGCREVVMVRHRLPVRIRSPRSAARRRSPRWRTAPRVSRAWIRSSAPVTPSLPKRKSRCTVPLQSI